MRLPCKSVSAPALHPDGRVVTAVCDDGSQRTVIRSWRVEPDGLREVMTMPAGPDLRVRYSPSGRFLLVQYRGGQGSQIWDVAAENAPSLWTTFSVPEGSSSELRLGRNDQVAVETTAHGAVLWDISVKGRAPVRVASFHGFDGHESSVRYRPDHDDFVAPVFRTGLTLWRFPLSADHAKAALCARGDVDLSDEQWERFLHGVERTSVC